MNGRYKVKVLDALGHELGSCEFGSEIAARFDASDAAADRELRDAGMRVVEVLDPAGARVLTLAVSP
jgi:hypothetical protein